MNRRIKFRTWNNFSQKWDELSIPVSGINSEGSEFIIQQYTGLNDINQKDIYEGDIIKYQYIGAMSDPNVYEESGEVYFENGSFWVNNKLLGNSYFILNPIVIGNIFESPELLDDTKISSNLPKRGRGRPKKEIF